MHNKSNQQGVLILMALVMTMVLLVSSAVIATITIRESRVSGNVDRGLTAFYDTESSAEGAFYSIFQDGNEAVTLDGTSGTSPSGGTWERIAKVQTDEFVIDFLPTGAVETIQVYNLLSAGEAAGLTGLSAQWSSGSEIRADLYAWDGADLTGPSSQTLSCVSSPCSGTINLSPGLAYEINLTVVGTATTDLILSTSPSGTLVDTSPTIVVQSEYQGAEQALELTIPQSTPWESGGGNPCGNGLPDPGEVCDDGDGGAPGGTCNADCSALTFCGDDTIQNPNGQGGNEQCDDGNTTPGDGCDATCQSETPSPCGNGLPDPGEACDDGDGGLPTGTCNADCSAFTTCGDGTVQSPNGVGQNEQCEPPSSGSCNASCLQLLTFTNAVQLTFGCFDATTQLTLTDNTGDPSMALGDYVWGWGPGGANTCNWINYTSQGTLESSIINLTRANDPNQRFIFMGEEAGGCSQHDFRIYDRQTDSVRTATIANPCVSINYTGYDPAWIADQVGAAMGW